MKRLNALLSASDLIDMRPRRDAYVALLGPRELVEPFELMPEIEASCARLAAQRLGAADRAAINEAHAACCEAVAAGDNDAYYPANARFHAVIYAATGNRVLGPKRYGCRPLYSPIGGFS